MKKSFGAELYAYQEFMVKPDAAKWIETNIESYIDIIYPEDPALWSVVITARGQFEEWIKKNKRGQRAQWLTAEYVDTLRKNLVEGGVNSSLNYYRALHEDLNREDENKIQARDFKTDKPVFFGATMLDRICVPSLHIPTIQSVASDLTLVEFETGHWVSLEQPDKLNTELERWLTRVG